MGVSSVTIQQAVKLQQDLLSQVRPSDAPPLLVTFTSLRCPGSLHTLYELPRLPGSTIAIELLIWTSLGVMMTIGDDFLEAAITPVWLGCYCVEKRKTARPNHLHHKENKVARKRIKSRSKKNVLHQFIIPLLKARLV
ncbi:hypothetical protein ElyMa_006561700 [Elysia marginata]|uniref:Uncharacterized protein n=1 Tax=Elysia marginata TaxID=1093978 RepID=A0AAV4I9I7_9GAST|nr:hypothetical protein ElyMa_006561700 [Elysia marginata]